MLERTRQRYASGGVTVLEPLGFDNTFAILVRRADAESLAFGRSAISKAQQRWQPGFGYEFVERQDGYRGLAPLTGSASRATRGSWIWR